MRKLALCVCLLAAPLLAQEFKLGSPVTEFEIADLHGSAVKYSELKGGITVVMFIGTACPVSNAYNERMKSLYRDYAAKGVHFIFINANNSEPAAEVEAHARDHGFPFAVYKDKNNVAADRFGAQVTPESFVIDRAGVIRYHGYIDDALNEARVRNRGLRTALDAILAGQSVTSAETKAFGCTIKRRHRTT